MANFFDRYDTKKPVNFFDQYDEEDETPDPGVSAVEPTVADDLNRGGLAALDAKALADNPPEAPKAMAPDIPYQDKADAMYDAINMVDEGFNPAEVRAHFEGKLGIPWSEIEALGLKEGRRNFTAAVDQKAADEYVPAEPTGVIAPTTPDNLDGVKNFATRVAGRIQQINTGVQYQVGLSTGEGAARSMAQHERKIQGAPVSEEMRADLEAIGKTTTFADAAIELARRPAATGMMLAESLAVSAPSLVASAMGLPAKGLAAATFATSGSMEFGSALNEALAERGLSLLDVEEVSKALNDPEFKSLVREKGAKRGLTIGAVDALTAGVAGRFIEPALAAVRKGEFATTAARRTAVASAWAKELGTQIAGGAGGEAGAQLLDKGRVDAPSEIILEGLAEGVSSPLEVASNLRAADNLPPEARIGRAMLNDVNSAQWAPGSAAKVATDLLSPDGPGVIARQMKAPSPATPSAPSAAPIAASAPPPNTPIDLPAPLKASAKWRSPDGIDYPVDVLEQDVTADDGSLMSRISYNGVEALIPRTELVSEAPAMRSFTPETSVTREAGLVPIVIPERTNAQPTTLRPLAAVGSGQQGAVGAGGVADGGLALDAGRNLPAQNAPLGADSREAVPVRGAADQPDAGVEGWTTFTPETGTLAVPRAEMPQIKAEHRGAMTQYLKARGITHSEETVPATDLKPTQAEFSTAKVLQAKEFKGGDRAILVSSDGYVLDGHHQWLAAMDDGKDVRTIRLDAPIQDLIQQTKEFPSSTLAGDTNAQTTGGVPRGLTASVTPDTQRYSQRLDRFLQLPAGSVQLQEVSRTEMPEPLTSALAAFEGVTGVRTAIVRNLNPKAWSGNGVTLRDGVVLVDETADAPVTTVATHEFTHNLRRSAPDLYQVLEDEVRRQGLLPEWSTQITRDNDGQKLPDSVEIEELTSNAVGDAFQDRAFLQKMAQRNPSKFKQLVDSFVAFLNQVLNKKDLGSNKYLQDVEAFRDLLLDVMDKYVPQSVKQAAAEPVQSTRTVDKALRANEDSIYQMVIDATDSGPFDGGCVVMAQGIQKAFGGELVALVRADDTADHAAVQIGTMFYDYDGSASERGIIRRFNDSENAKVTGVRPLTPTDLPEAPRDSKAAAEIAALLSPKTGVMTTPDRSRGDGRAFTGFFSNITEGFKGAPSGKAFEPVLDITGVSEFVNEYNTHRGNFDDHIGSSIPTFRELQTIVGDAIVKTFSDADMLDIGASEGALAKTITKLSDGSIRTVAMDPAPAMEKHFSTGEKVKGSKFVIGAFGEKFDEGKVAWTEGDTLEDRDGATRPNPWAGKAIRFFKPDRKFDVVHEAMVFQFINSDRAQQVARVKELMNEGGIAILEEKFIPGDGLSKKQFDVNEAQKDDFKEQYFTKAEIAAKAAAVGVKDQEAYRSAQAAKESSVVGMADLMVAPRELESVLLDNFQHVVQFWDAGNFKGYLASDDRVKLDKLLGNMQSTDSEFSNVDTPRWVDAPAQSRRRADDLRESIKRIFKESSYYGARYPVHKKDLINAVSKLGLDIPGLVEAINGFDYKVDYETLVSKLQGTPLYNPKQYANSSVYWRIDTDGGWVSVTNGFTDADGRGALFISESSPNLSASAVLDAVLDHLGDRRPRILWRSAQSEEQRATSFNDTDRSDFWAVEMVKAARDKGLPVRQTSFNVDTTKAVRDHLAKMTGAGMLPEEFDAPNKLAQKISKETGFWASAYMIPGVEEAPAQSRRQARTDFRPDRQTFGDGVYNADGTVFEGVTSPLITKEMGPNENIYWATRAFASGNRELLRYPEAKLGVEGRTLTLRMATDQEMPGNLTKQEAEAILAGGDGINQRRELTDAQLQRFEDARAANATGLEGAIDENGRVTLTHWSRKPITETDPTKFGSGLSRNSPGERGQVGTLLPRTYFGIMADENPYILESGLGMYSNEYPIDGAKLYPVNKDPDGLWHKDDQAAWERDVYEAGYDGYFVDHPGLGKVAAVFVPLVAMSRRQTDTPEFKQWFGDSKVVDESGQPLVVYHGTTKGSKFSAFRVPAFFTDSREFAERYAENDGVVADAYLSLQNPVVIDAMEHELGADAEELANDPAWVDSMATRGFDGLVVKDNGITTFVAFSPNQIKSATGNVGTFDAENADIRFSRRFAPDKKDFTRRLKEDGGVTYNADGSVFTSKTGYSVGLFSANVENAKGAYAAMVKFASDNEALLRYPDAKIGAFKFPGSDQVSIDLSLVTQDRDTAVRIGEENNQHSIWSYSTRSGIETGGNGDGVLTRAEAEQILFEEGFAKAPDYRNAAIKLARKKGIPEDQSQRYTNETGVSARPAEPRTREVAFSRREVTPLGFYSALTEKLGERKNARARKDEWKAIIRGLPGVKAEEVEWSGVTDWLDTQDGVIEKDAVLDYLRNNGVQVEEVTLGGKLTHEDLLWNAGLRGVHSPESAQYGFVEDMGNGAFIWNTPGRSRQRFDSLQDAKDAVLEYANRNPRDDTKYKKYAVPGGENYRVVLLTLPFPPMAAPEVKEADDGLWEVLWPNGDQNEFGTEQDARDFAQRSITDPRQRYNTRAYQSSHWDQPNVLAHIRMDDRADNTLFIQEVQSDWGQEGRKKGFREGFNVFLKGTTVPLFDGNGDTLFATREAAQAVVNAAAGAPPFQAAEIRPATSGVPNAPFVKDTKAWTALALKRVITHAVEQGYDRVAFVNGDQAAAMFDLSKQVSEIAYNKNTQFLRVLDTDGREIFNGTKPLEELPDFIGKEASEKIEAGGNFVQLRDLDLKIGGEGMRGFYDAIVPQVLRDVLKKVGGKVERIDVPVSASEEDDNTYYLSGRPGYFKDSQQLGFTITPEMRATVGEGVPLFSRRSQEYPRIEDFQGMTLRRPTADIRVVAASALADGPFTIMPGVREVQFSEAPMQEASVFDSEKEQQRVVQLAKRIEKNQSIDPLFVVVRPDGSAYIAEGQHRARALKSLGYESYPARVAVGAPAQSRRSVMGNTINGNWSAPDPTKMDKFIYEIQDRHVDTKQVVKAINAQVGQIQDKWDPYLQEGLYHGRTAEKVSRFLDNELKPLFRDMQARGVTLDQLEEFLTMSHAKEVNAYVAKINPSFNGPGSGISDADVNAYMNGLSVAERTRLFGAARQVWDIIRSTQDLLVTSGLEKQETINRWRGAFPFYVPFERDLSDDFGMSLFAGIGTGQGMSVRGGSSRRLTGSTKPIINVLGNLSMQRERAIVRAEKNRVALAMFGLAAQNPNTDFWLPINPDMVLTGPGRARLQQELINVGIDPLDARNIAEEPTQSVVDPQTGLVVQRINPQLRSNPNVLSVRINGENRHVIFNANNPRAARMVTAMKNLDMGQMHWALEAVAPVTRYFASVNTQYNPIFGVTNFTRDLQFGALSITSTEIAGKEADVIAGVLPALHGVYSDLRSRRKLRGSTSTPWAQLWEDFKEQGGQTGYREQFKTSDERAKAITREFNRLKGGISRKAWDATFGWLSDYNESLENAVRLSAYKVALDQGLSKERAAMLAKNLTVNFNRKGAIGQQMGAMYAFFNAAVQGTETLVRTMKGPAGKQIFIGGVALGVAQAMALALAGYGDDEPPEFVRERNFIIPLFNEDKDYLSIPMPLGFHIIPNIGRKLTEQWLSEWDDTGGAVVDMVGMLFEAFNPIGSAGWSMQTLLPTVMDPGAALSENRDWSGKPIYQEAFNKNDVSPGIDRARDTSSFPSKFLAKYLNYASGGTDFVAGEFSPTPDQIDYLIGQVTGGVGREALKAAQVVETQFTGEELPLHKIPLAGRFYGSATGASSASGPYYAHMERMAEHRAEMEGRMEKGLSTAEYKAENPDARYAFEALMSERLVQSLRKVKREFIERGEDKQRVADMDAKIRKEMERFNEKIGDRSERRKGFEIEPLR